ncbi:MAG TPA: EpsG family protein [Allosphingosinicella sp.]|jgi:hypothetical protein
MIPYWLLFSYFAAGALQSASEASSARQGQALLIVGALITAILIGLRYDVGGDWENYEFIFYTLQYSTFAQAAAQIDPGYAALNVIAHKLGLGIWFVNVICAILFTWGLTRFIRRQPLPWLAFTISIPYLVTVVAMGYTRQAVAISLILVALEAYDRKSFIAFVVAIVAAAAFHKSAVLLVPFAGISAGRNRSLVLLSSAIFALFLYWVFVASSVDQLTINYTTGELQSEGAFVRVGMSIVPAVLFLAYQRRFAFNEQSRKLWRNFAIAALLAVIPLLAAPNLSTAVDRLALYLIPLQIVVLSRLPIVFYGKAARGLDWTALITLYSGTVLYVWLTYATHSQYWLPYKSYLFVNAANSPY